MYTPTSTVTRYRTDLRVGAGLRFDLEDGTRLRSIVLAAIDKGGYSARFARNLASPKHWMYGDAITVERCAQPPVEAVPGVKLTILPSKQPSTTTVRLLVEAPASILIKRF